ncbi:adenylosuccinate lyase [bacterium]|nr:adenylosuccinate lyase [bacterium]
MSKDYYSNPLVGRYAGEQMSHLFSMQKRLEVWRALWIALADEERKLGLPITAKQVKELEKYATDINFDVAEKYEREVRHDVMAHVKAYGDQAKSAAGIIHLGATSCYVTDNADLIIYRDALRLVSDHLVDVMRSLAAFCEKYRKLPTLGFTHLQPAQLTTVGKRASLWLQDLQLDFENVQFAIEKLRFRGIKGTTGTQASFMELFKGDQKKIKALDKALAKRFNFSAAYAVGGQTYPRKVDADVMHPLVTLALSACKMTNDIRYLQSIGEIEEPFGKKQIGSSAMAYKRNPMRCERTASLSRLILSLATSPQLIASTQFLERTLDDSANRRISIPEAFLAADAVLAILKNVCSGLVVYPKVIAKRVQENLPFMATEAIIMEAVARGKSRQDVHEAIRCHSMDTVKQIRSGGTNDLIKRLGSDPAIGISEKEIAAILDPMRFTGRAQYQVEDYLKEIIKPLLRRYRRNFPSQEAQVKY